MFQNAFEFCREHSVRCGAERRRGTTMPSVTLKTLFTRAARNGGQKTGPDQHPGAIPWPPTSSKPSLGINIKID